MITRSESEVGVGPIDGAFLLVGSVAVWFAYNFCLFIATCLVVAATLDSIPWRGWMFVGFYALLPIVLLAVVAYQRSRAFKPLFPTTSFGRTMFAVQGLGILGLCVAILVPTLLFWSYFHPGLDLDVRNESRDQITVSIKDDTSCSADGVVAAESRASIGLLLEGDLGTLSCWGADVAELLIVGTGGTWMCTWPADEADSRDRIRAKLRSRRV